MNRRKSITLAILVVLLLTFAVSGTIAYITTKTDPVKNVFTPATVDTDVVETFTKNVKSNVYVTNASSNIAVFVRAKVVANWCDASGNIVAPWTDNIEYNEGTTSDKWTTDGDYWYYNSKVAAGGQTENLFNSYTYTAADVPVKGAHLVMTIIHQSIQADGLGDGVDTAQEAFTTANSTTSSN